MAVITLTTTALLSKSVPEYPVKGRVSAASAIDLFWILSWLALSSGPENRITDADVFTVGTGKGRQNGGCFLSDVIYAAEQHWLWIPASSSKQRAPGRRQHANLDLRPCLVSELSEFA